MIDHMNNYETIKHLASELLILDPRDGRGRIEDIATELYQLATQGIFLTDLELQDREAEEKP